MKILRAMEAAVPVLLIANALGAQSPRLVRDVGAVAPSFALAFEIRGGNHGPGQNELVFAGDDGIVGSEVWRTDGTAAGTRLLADLAPGSASSMFWGAVGSPGLVWIVAGSGGVATLWCTNGTPGGAIPIYSSPYGPLTQLPPQLPQTETPLGSVLFFNTPTSLARTTFTPGTGSTFALNAPRATVRAIRGSIAILESYDNKIVVSDGNTAAVVLSNASCLDGGPGRLLLSEFLNVGTPQQQMRFTLVEAPGAASLTLPGFVVPVAMRDKFVFLSNAALWSWSGSGPATQLSGPPLGGVFVVPGADGMLFAGDDAQSGGEPWFSDGTLAGTHAIDLTPGPASTVFTIAGAVGDRWILWVTTPTNGSEPWITDGTLAGTSLLKDVEAGPGSSQPDFLFDNASISPVGSRRFLLPITTSAHGREIWITDLTAAGTQLVSDVMPGPVSSLRGIRWFPMMAGNTAIWFADDGVHGTEPWALDLDGAALPLQQQGPRRFTPADPVLGSTWQLRSSGLQLADLGFVLLGLPLPLPFALGAGQFVHFDVFGSLLLANIVPGPNGEWTNGIALPSDPSLVALDLIAEPLFAPSLQAAGVDLGDAWWITLGF